MSEFQNVITALVTPFNKGEIDELSFVRLLHQQLEGGVRGFVINGTTGESPTLKLEEVRRLLEIARAEAGRRGNFILGTGTNSTSTTIETTKLAKSWGADGALVVVPYYNKPPQRGLVAHFSRVACEVDIPIILYNVPSRTITNLDFNSVAQLSEISNIVGIKDATGDMSVISELTKIPRSNFALLSGDDETTVEFCKRGGHGVISVASNIIPKEMVEMVSKAKKSDARADALLDQYRPLMKWLFIEANPIAVKWALWQMGILRSTELRLPLVELAPQHAEGFKACLKNLGKL